VLSYKDYDNHCYTQHDMERHVRPRQTPVSESPEEHDVNVDLLTLTRVGLPRFALGQGPMTEETTKRGWSLQPCHWGGEDAIGARLYPSNGTLRVAIPPGVCCPWRRGCWGHDDISTYRQKVSEVLVRDSKTINPPLTTHEVLRFPQNSRGGSSDALLVGSSTAVVSNLTLWHVNSRIL
jgi:hypothetical protein